MQGVIENYEGFWVNLVSDLEIRCCRLLLFIDGITFRSESLVLGIAPAIPEEFF